VLNVAFYATHAVDGDKRQYMPQKASMGLYENDTIPIPATGTNEAWEKMPNFFNERNFGRIRLHWRYENETLHQSMMKNYYRMATEVDSTIGVICDELKRQGEYEKTIIIFTTDNGNFHSVSYMDVE
jgi:arylsulfatase A-like enzyme